MSASVRTKHAFATGLAVVMTGGGLAAVAAPAHAETGPLAYTCSYDGQPYSVGVNTDTNAPGSLDVGASADVVVSSRLTFPSALVEAMYADGARSFAGTVVANATLDQAPISVDETIQSTSLGDQMPPVAVEFVATSGVVPVKVSAPGDLVVGAVDLTANLTVTKADGSAAAAALSCKAPAGKAPVIDTVRVVARTTTELTLSPATTEYGDTVTATAKVTPTGGTAAGVVTFVINGVSSKVDVKDGSAALDIKGAVLGDSQVSATFTPTDAAHFQGSSATAASLRITKAETSTKVKLTGKRVRQATGTTIKVVGINKTVATGKVKLVLRKVGNKGFQKAKSGTLAKGSRGFNLGRLGAGRYQVVVTYLGDANHQDGKTIKRFRVRR